MRPAAPPIPRRDLPVGVEGARGDGAVGGVEGDATPSRARRPLGGVDAGEELAGDAADAKYAYGAERVGEADVTREAGGGAPRGRAPPRPLVVDAKLDQRGGRRRRRCRRPRSPLGRATPTPPSPSPRRLPRGAARARDRTSRQQSGGSPRSTPYSRGVVAVAVGAAPRVEPSRRARSAPLRPRGRAPARGRAAVGLDAELDEQHRPTCGRRRRRGGAASAARRARPPPLPPPEPLEARAERRTRRRPQPGHVARVDRTELDAPPLTVAKRRRERHARRRVDGASPPAAAPPTPAPAPPAPTSASARARSARAHAPAPASRRAAVGTACVEARSAARRLARAVRPPRSRPRAPPRRRRRARRTSR